MKKILIFSLLSCLPFTHMASVTVSIAGAAFKNNNIKSETSSGTKTQVLPLNTLYYFIQ